MRTNERVTTRWAATALAIAALAACGGGSSRPTNDLPAGITEMGSTDYRATTAGTGATAAAQDLLTGGIGKTGLGAAAAPAYADPASPSVAELRRNAIFSNYRGILDYTPGGGYGSLYGPNVTLEWANGFGHRRIVSAEPVIDRIVGFFAEDGQRIAA